MKNDENQDNIENMNKLLIENEIYREALKLSKLSYSDGLSVGISMTSDNDDDVKKSYEVGRKSGIDYSYEAGVLLGKIDVLILLHEKNIIVLNQDNFDEIKKIKINLQSNMNVIDKEDLKFKLDFINNLLVI